MKASYVSSAFSNHSEIDVKVITEVLAASSDACWCMEFRIPVELKAPDQEVVRQVFENDPYWRLSNPAMAQLYLLPSDQSFNERPVHEIFPRNKQNEELVLNLIANGFEVDAAPALDTRYDGVQVYVENDVRAHIHNGRLVRMFGIVRDVGKHQRREAELQSQLSSTMLVLEAIPWAVFGISKSGEVVVANSAAEQLLTKKINEIIGQNLVNIISKEFGASTASVLDTGLSESIERSYRAPSFFQDKTSNSNWSICISADTSSVAAVVTVSHLNQTVQHA